jgi:hypothetical protein
MAVIYAYPTVVPELQDLLIGTEMAIQGGEDAPRARTFTIQSIVDLVETASQLVPNLQQVTTAGPTTTNGITITTNANLAVPIKGIANWQGVGGLNNVAVSGFCEFGGTAVKGEIPSGAGGIGVKGIALSGIGVYGESSEGSGVKGTGSKGVEGIGSSYGVYGIGSDYGVYGVTNSMSGNGVYGEATAAGYGVAGRGYDGYGGYFYSENTHSIYAEQSIYAQGAVTAQSFVKIQGSPTQSLMANGTTRNISFFNNSTSPQNITAATVTYLTGSNISTANIKAGSVVNWDIAVLKTAAGVAPPVFTVRFGTTGTTADSTLLTFTGSAQTAVVDGGLFSIKCTFKTVGTGTTAVLAGYYTLMHNAQVVGLSVLPVNFSFQTSPGFNSTLTNAVLGITVDSGAAAVWTINQVSVKLENQV